MPETTCKVCNTVEAVALVEHLKAAHTNEMLDIETDPRTGVSVIHGRV